MFADIITLHALLASKKTGLLGPVRVLLALPDELSEIAVAKRFSCSDNKATASGRATLLASRVPGYRASCRLLLGPLGYRREVYARSAKPVPCTVGL